MIFSEQTLVGGGDRSAGFRMGGGQQYLPPDLSGLAECFGRIPCIQGHCRRNAKCLAPCLRMLTEKAGLVGPTSDKSILVGLPDVDRAPG